MKWKIINTIPTNTATDDITIEGIFEDKIMQPKNIKMIPRPIYVNKNGQYFLMAWGIEFSLARCIRHKIQLTKEVTPPFCCCYFQYYYCC